MIYARRVINQRMEVHVIMGKFVISILLLLLVCAILSAKVICLSALAVVSPPCTCAVTGIADHCIYLRQIRLPGNAVLHTQEERYDHRYDDRSMEDHKQEGKDKEQPLLKLLLINPHISVIQLQIKLLL